MKMILQILSIAWQDVKDCQTQLNLGNLPEKQKGDVTALLESFED